MGTVGIRVPTRQIREFSAFSLSSALRHSPSARRVIGVNDISRSLNIFLTKALSHLRTLSRYDKLFRVIVCI
jgi:hypothetical protein